jgi:hypothetical protein
MNKRVTYAQVIKIGEQKKEFQRSLKQLMDSGMNLRNTHQDSNDAIVCVFATEKGFKWQFQPYFCRVCGNYLNTGSSFCPSYCPRGIDNVDFPCNIVCNNIEHHREMAILFCKFRIAQCLRNISYWEEHEKDPSPYVNLLSKEIALYRKQIDINNRSNLPFSELFEIAYDDEQC